MPRAIGAYEAKTHLPRLLDEVAGGETITITKHGVPVAVLSPAVSAERRDVDEVIAEVKRARAKIRLRGLSLRRMIADGRR